MLWKTSFAVVTLYLVGSGTSLYCKENVSRVPCNSPECAGAYVANFLDFYTKEIRA